MINIPEQVRILLDQGALFAVNDSGGKDSQAMRILLQDVIPPQQLLVIHATLGRIEWPSALEHAREGATRRGLAFVVAKAGKDLLEMVDRRYQTRTDVPSWPSSSTRQCTSDLKRDPIDRELRRILKERGLTNVVSCVGIRAEESSRRAKAEVLRVSKRNSVAGRTWLEWLPIHELKVSDVFRIIRDAGEEPHWAYTAGNDRLSCIFCIMACRGDLINGAKHNPALYREYVAMELKTGYTMHMSRKSLVEMVGWDPEEQKEPSWNTNTLPASEWTSPQVVCF